MARLSVWRFAVRFFSTVPLHSRPMLAGIGLLGLVGLVTLVADPTRGAEVTLLVVLLQMFAVSSGFLVPARRGHFDLVLTTDGGRVCAAVTHWLVSAAPGVAVWTLLGVAEALLQGRAGPVLSAGSLGAMVLVSLLAWAGTVPLPRLSGGVIWLILMAASLVATGGWQADGRVPLLGAAAGWPTPIRWLVCPLLLAGMDLGDGQWMRLVPGLAAALCGWVAAVAGIRRASLGLEAAQ